MISDRERNSSSDRMVYMKKINGKILCRRILFTIALPAIVYLVLGILRPDIYFKGSTFVMLFTQSISYTVIGWAMVFGMSVGLFDFSVGSRIILAGLFGIHMSQYMGLFGFVAGTLAASLLMAAFTGGVYALFKIPSIITGFAALLIFESLATIYQKQFSVVVSDSIKVLGISPGIYIVGIVTFVAVYVIFNNTKFGYQIKAIGGNEGIAKSMGINSVKLKVMTYIVGGLFLAVASMIKVGNTGTMIGVTSMQSMQQCFTPMMGVMIGLYLTSCNPVVGVFIGEFAITIVSSGLVALGIESRLQNVVVGIFLLVFIGMKTNADSLHLKERFSKKKAFG